MKTTSSDNFYLLLELFLDPPEENWWVIEARINEKKNVWNKKRNNPDGIIYQRLSERVEEIRTTLRDANERKKQGAAARREKLRELDEQIASRSGETIAPEQVNELVKDFRGVFSEATIRSRVKVPICDATPTRRVPDPPIKPQDDPTLPRFDSLKLREVKVCLQALGKKTIYEALGVARASTATRLREAAENAMKEARVASAKTAEINAKQTLGGLAKEFFKDEKSKKGFETAWANFQFEEKLKPVFNGRIVQKKENGKDVKFVTEENYERSLREATEEGMAPQAAEWFVYNYYINQRKCPDPRVCDAGQAFTEKVNCPNCFRQNEKSAACCVECGYALKTKCPKCGVNNVLSEFCSNCGFSFGDMANSDLALQRAKEALDCRDFDQALREWNKAKGYWAENAKLEEVAALLRDGCARSQFEKFERELAAGRVDEALRLRQNFSFDGKTSRLVDELEQRADKLLREESDCLEIVKKINALLRENRVFEAEQELANVPIGMRLRSAIREKSDEVDRAVQRAYDELNGALNVETGDDKERKLNELIKRYPGFQQAQNELETLPPVAPNGVRAQATDGGVALTWSQRSPRGVSCYRITRFQADGDVNSEGTVVCENCEEREFLDATAEEFKRYYYEVVALNIDGYKSCAAQSEAVVRIGKARDIKVETKSKQINVTWKTSPNVGEIKVYRKNLSRPSEERVRVEPVDVNGFTDAGLEDYVQYEYEVTLTYRDNESRLYTSEPQRFKVVPHETRNDLSCEYKDGKVEVSWSEPNDGSEVFLWVMPKPSRLLMGQVTRVTWQALSERLGAQPEKIQGAELTVSGRRVIKIDAKRQNKAVYVLLAMKNGEFLTLCAEKSVYCLKPAANFYAQYTSNGCVYFSWDWPSNVNEVIIYANRKEQPREENYSQCERYLLKKADYLKECAWRRSNNEQGIIYYRLHMVYEFGEKKLVSPGLDFRSRRSFIEYEKIDDDTLQFTTDDVNYCIPEICVVRRLGRPPYRRDDGDMILTISASHGARTKRFSLSNYCEEPAPLGRTPYYRCYFKNYADTLNFVLLDPPNAELKWPIVDSRATPQEAPVDDGATLAVGKEAEDETSPPKDPVKRSIWRRMFGRKSR